MFDYEEIKNADGQGGFLIPKVAYVDRPRLGVLSSSVRWIGQRIIYFGSWVRSLGYYQVEIHPHDDLIKKIKEMEMLKGKS